VTTGWHFSITRHARYAPYVSNYSAAAAGRTFPSAAGFHTAELFFTEDLDFYDRFFRPCAYLRTHAEHMQRRGEQEPPMHQPA
jgi:hypothetical protein